jgi:predicted enzyme related to lactoylglutathione lyase
MPVLGMGGLFFRARDPGALKAWYKEHLGVGGGCSATGETITDYFAAEKSFMTNFRVSDLDQLLGKLREAGVEVTTKPEWDTPEVGRFARIHDPEGNAIELWEPPAGA